MFLSGSCIVFSLTDSTDVKTGLYLHSVPPVHTAGSAGLAHKRVEFLIFSSTVENSAEI